MKKIIALVLVLTLAVVLVACGGGGAGGGKNGIVGVWQIQGETSTEDFGYGFYWQFTKNGDLNFVIKTEDGTYSSESEGADLSMLFDMSYKISGNTITITTAALGGLVKESEDYSYEVIDNDTMKIGDDTYKRVG